MIQEVVGTRVGPYFLPSFAGVAFSNNEFRWSPRIKREDGLLRMVPGLGTRAVDRLGDDYPILVAPGQPGLRVNVTPDEILRYAPRKIDVINIEMQRFETIDAADLFREYGRQYPALDLIAAVYDSEGIHRPVGFGWDPAESHTVVTFDGLIGSTPFMARMKALLKLLRERIGSPVDIEFASDGKDLYLLQCRPQSFSRDAVPSPIPRDLPYDRIVFSASKYVSNGRVPDITHIVYVDPEEYDRLENLTELKDVGRAVGRLNKMLPKRQFVLMGPGRWGSRGVIKLGVSVTYSDINNTAVLMEIAAKRGNYTPDLSFGTHFFQDLVEAGIRYLPLFPGEPGQVCNDLFLRRAPNILAELLPEYAHLAHVVHVIDMEKATDGLILQVLMNADLDEAVGYFAAPTQGLTTTQERRADIHQVTEDHWRWRLRMAEHIAAEIDPDRFGIKGIYVFGSTKNATAGPGSDIDLIVHVDAVEDTRQKLELWLEGWSLCLSEINYLRTGYRTEGLLDVKIVGDEDFKNHSSFASKIGAITDPARALAIRRTTT
jgi:pyruvate,water dikinase